MDSILQSAQLYLASYFSSKRVLFLHSEQDLVVAISFIISSSFFFKLDISLRNSGLAATFTDVTFLRPCPQVPDGLASENLLMYSNYYF